MGQYRPMGPHGVHGAQGAQGAQGAHRAHGAHGLLGWGTTRRELEVPSGIAPRNGIAYMDYNGDRFRHYICNYWYEVGTKFDDCGTEFDEPGKKYNPEVIKYYLL